MKSILITGSSGMVGKALVKLLKKNYKILTPSSKKLDLNNSKNITKYLKKEKPTHIVHLAGYVGGIGANINNPINFLQHNIYMGLNLIKASHDLKIKNFLNIGSSCIYPPNQSKPNNETNLLNGKIEPTNEGYAIAKITCIKMCEYISKSSSLNYFSLIPCNIYGPFDKFNITDSHVMGALIKKIHIAKKNKKNKVEIWGDGKPRREFIYVDDIVNAIKIFLFKKNLTKKKIYWINIGSGVDYSIRYLAKKIAKELKYNGKFIYNINKPNGAKSKLLDIKLSNVLGFKPKIKLDQGLKNTVQWYLKNYKTLKYKN